MTHAKALTILAQTDGATAGLRKPGIQEAIARLSERSGHWTSLAARLEETQALNLKISPDAYESLMGTAAVVKLGERIREHADDVIARAGVGDKLSATAREALKNLGARPPTLDLIVTTAEALTSVDKPELEIFLSTAGDELGAVENDAAALSPISAPVAAWFAALAISVILAMLLRWTDFEISQADQAVIDIALQVLSGLPMLRWDEPARLD